jgi:anaerobic ribonucleoside-triphosphate reductase activating protein
MNYHNITYPDMNNGDGLRVVLWLSGCSHHCKGCQNPQTWDAKSGIPFDEKAKEELFRELNKDYISGITLTGGDPLHKDNVEEVLNLVIEIKDKFPNKTIWLYSGYTWEEIMFPLYIKNNPSLYLHHALLVKMCNVFVDGQYIEMKRDITLKWRGSSNQRVIDVEKSCGKDRVVLYCD